MLVFLEIVLSDIYWCGLGALELSDFEVISQFTVGVVNSFANVSLHRHVQIIMRFCAVLH